MIQRTLLPIVVVIATCVAALSPQSSARAATGSTLGTRNVRWLMAGDSYSSGQGLDDNVGACARSARAYPSVAYNRLAYTDSELESHWQPVIVACSGDVIDHFRLQTAEASRDFNDASFDPSVLPGECRRELNVVNGETWADSIKRDGNHLANWTNANCSNPDARYDLITFTFGGNDVGFAGVLEGCLMAPWVDSATSWDSVVDAKDPLCPSQKDLHQRIENLKASSGITYDAQHNPNGVSYSEFIRQVSERYLAPGGRIFVLGYPHIFARTSDWPWYDAECQGMTSDLADMLRTEARHLDTVIKNQVEAAQGNGVPAQYVSVIDEFDKGDHNLCGSGTDWMNGVSSALPRSFHTNKAGNDAEAQLLEAAVRNSPPDGTSPPTATGITPCPVLDGDTGQPSWMNGPIASDTTLPPDITLPTGANIYVTGIGDEFAAPDGFGCKAITGASDRAVVDVVSRTDSSARIGMDTGGDSGILGGCGFFPHLRALTADQYRSDCLAPPPTTSTVVLAIQQPGLEVAAFRVPAGATDPILTQHPSSYTVFGLVFASDSPWKGGETPGWYSAARLDTCSLPDGQKAVCEADMALALGSLRSSAFGDTRDESAALASLQEWFAAASPNG